MVLDAFSVAGEDGFGVNTAAKRFRRRRGSIELPRPPQLPLPFPAFGEEGTFHMRAADGCSAGFNHVYSARYIDSWAAEVTAQQGGFAGALRTNLRGPGT